MAVGRLRKKCSRPKSGINLPPPADRHSSHAAQPASPGDPAMSVLDDYLVDPNLSLLDKTRIQAQVLVPVLQALRAEIGKERADAIVRQALRDWSKQLF